MNFSTRPATIDDTAFARSAHHLGYREVVERQFGPWDEADQDRRFASDWKTERFVMLIVDGQTCGYARTEILPDQISVVELVVHPRFQNRGIATIFLHQVMEKASTLGLPVQLGTFTKSRALKLYRRLGFREFDRTDTHVLFEWRPEKTD
jgi:GNAT superfamily N-acetyltransferase